VHGPGIGTATEWSGIVPRKLGWGSVPLFQQENPIGGDFIPFYDAGIPVLNFFSGIHEQYHRPSDDVALVNFEGEASC